MAERAGKKLGNIVIWGLMALLILGLGGFGITNFGSTVSAVMHVGEEPVAVNEYYRELTAEMAAEQQRTGESLSVAAAEQRGVIARVRTRLIARAALDGEAARLGLSVGDERVREQVLAAPAFQGLNGRFDRTAYQQALRYQGLSVEEYEAGVRKDTARTILQGAVVGGLPAPELQVNTLLDYFGERRSFRWVKITEEALDEPLPEPTDEELKAYYQANTPDFTLPEMKRITYVWVTPGMLIDSVEIDEESARKLYEERIDEFRRPERRLLERLVFSSDEAAAEARRKLDAGETGFQDLVEGRGLTLEQVDMGEVSRSALPAEAGEAVFALGEPGVVGPFPTDLGPAIFRMNGILAAMDTPFEDARGDLTEELAQERATRIIADMETEIEDKLAGGATLEELADETDLELGTIEFWDGLGEGIANYNSFRDAALAVTEDDFPDLGRLEDGGIFALRLDEVLEPRLQPMTEVRGKVVAGWETRETETRLRGKAEELAAQLEAGAPLSSGPYPVEESAGLTRDGFIDGTPPALVRTAFEMAPGEHRILEAFGNAFLVELTEVLPPDPEDERMNLLRQLVTQQSAQSTAVDLYSYFAQALANQAGVQVDNSALAQVHAQISTR